jgi:hypothetical protein
MPRTSCLLTCLLLAATYSDVNAVEPLSIGAGSDWSFVGRAWQDGDGRFTIPSGKFSLRLALNKRAVYDDVTVACDLNPQYNAVGGGDAGIIIRAQDASHYYWIHEPWVGQTTRAKNFWLAISVVDETGWDRHLKLEVVPGVPSEMERWYRIRVEAKGTTIRTWVDGHPGPSVTDDTYEAGAVGIGGYGWFHMRNMTITGNAQSKAQAAWQAGPDQKIDWFHVLGDGPGAGSRQKPLTLRRLPSGTLVFQYGAHTDPGWWVSRSKDNGLTWEQPWGMPSDRQGFLHVTNDGRLLAWQFDEGKVFWFCESTDEGKTWGPRQEFAITNAWPEDPKLVPLFYGKGLYESPDGAWLVLLHGGLAESEKRDIYTWGSYAASCYSVRSTDQGKTWSTPICIDGIRKPGGSRGGLLGCLDLIEPVGAYTADGRFLVYCRPIYNPTMWQAVSNDGGKSWDAVSRGPFPGYAADMWSTSSGALLVSHRFPNHTINLSLDNGYTWDAGTSIDYPLEAAGKFAEVAPDVLLFIYRDDGQARMRAQYMRVTSQGLVKLPRNWQANAK